MEQLNYIVLIVILNLMSCSNSEDYPIEKEVSSVTEIQNVKANIAPKDSSRFSDINNYKTHECNCERVKYQRNYSTDLRFQDSEYDKDKNEVLFRKWSTDSLAKHVTSISFLGFDTIPKQYAIFKNVERLSIESRNGIYGLDIYPKLRSIHFFDSIIRLNTNENWLRQLEILIGQKTRFTDLKHFEEMPNLRVIDMGFSGFEKFPEGLNQLACLSEITLGAYIFGEIDLSTLDFSKNECLKKAEFHTWYNSFSGIPSGILESKIEELKINHQKLTLADKAAIEKIKSQLGIKYKGKNN